MRAQIEQARREVRRGLAGQTDWFLPEGRRHFDPVTAVGTLSVILITAFLKGFIDEAAKSAENAGRSSFRWLRQACADAFEAKPEAAEAQLAEAEREAERARALARTLSAEQRRRVIAQSEEALQQALAEIVPPQRATAIVTEVRTAVVTHVIEFEATRTAAPESRAWQPR